MHVPMSSSHLHAVPNRQKASQARPAKSLGDSLRCHDSKLGRKIGTVAALVFQQIQWFLHRYGQEIEGQWWVRLSLAELGDSLEGEVRPRTLSNKVDLLKKERLIRTRSDLNTSPFDRSIWYAIDEERFWAIRDSAPITPIKTEIASFAYSVNTSLGLLGTDWRHPFAISSMQNLQSLIYGSARAVFKREIRKEEDNTHSLNSDSSSEYARETEVESVCVEAKEMAMPEEEKIESPERCNCDPQLGVPCKRDAEVLKHYSHVMKLKGTLKKAHRFLHNFLHDAQDPHTVEQATWVIDYSYETQGTKKQSDEQFRYWMEIHRVFSPETIELTYQNTLLWRDKPEQKVGPCRDGKQHPGDKIYWDGTAFKCSRCGNPVTHEEAAAHSIQVPEGEDRHAIHKSDFDEVRRLLAKRG